MLDRCTRWHAAMVIPDKEPESIQKAIGTVWVSIHGPPKELITDQEGGLVKAKQSNEWLQRLGIKLHPRAKDQHARYIERRGALLETPSTGS